ncbi:uncharacterized protein ASCRUDRAFT_75467 [Ascoidea rubescens DSM 1968]|uniref:Uncharacterized protein n=1 Tax=Ascoidea rubescens DSM 1968 TaxID=1344418 RepID=A0A1D2VII5_9ASCO|nr:hypothetical protein ASCRUDRAFT_75467 [Ascoidea rubescens DSM 1968]ODV61456.1 hypothetical protein ASCRUDRAFT_75467 [Ascoidea rubescens DSM 1968]
MNDEENILEKLLSWIDNILNFLKFYKKTDDPNLKIDLNEFLKNNTDKINIEKLKKEVDDIVEEKNKINQFYEQNKDANNNYLGNMVNYHFNIDNTIDTNKNGISEIHMNLKDGAIMMGINEIDFNELTDDLNELTKINSNNLDQETKLDKFLENKDYSTGSSDKKLKKSEISKLSKEFQKILFQMLDFYDNKQ